MNPHPEQLDSESEQLAHMTEEEASRIHLVESKAGKHTGEGSVAALAKEAAENNAKAGMREKHYAQFPSEFKAGGQHASGSRGMHTLILRGLRMLKK